MTSVKELTVRILESYGYKMSEDGSLLVGKKNGSSVTVCFASHGLTKETCLALMNEMLGREGKTVVVSPEDTHEDAKRMLIENGIIVWDRQTLESEVGRLVLGSPAKASLPSLEEEITLKVEEKVAKEKPISGEKIISPRITQEDVAELAKQSIRGFRYELELVPYYVYEYSCELVVEGGREEERKVGVIGVNALSQDYEVWKSAFEIVSELKIPHTKLEPKIEEARATEIAEEGAIITNTTEKETVTDRGSVVIIEKRRVRPKNDAIELKKKGLLYLPVWCVEGSNGIMIVNAATGKIIREDFYKGED